MMWAADRIVQGFKSTQICTDPLALGAVTIAAHQSVGSVTFQITPSCSIRVSSASTLGRRGSGTFLAVY